MNLLITFWFFFLTLTFGRTVRLENWTLFRLFSDRAQPVFDFSEFFRSSRRRSASVGWPRSAPDERWRTLSHWTDRSFEPKRHYGRSRLRFYFRNPDETSTQWFWWRDNFEPEEIKINKMKTEAPFPRLLIRRSRFVCYFIIFFYWFFFLPAPDRKR